MDKKMYGVVKPKKVDFLLAFVFALVALTALWIGIWVAATKSFDFANQSLDLFTSAFRFNFFGTHYWFILAGNIVLFLSICYFVCLTLVAIIRKKTRAIFGTFAVLLAGFASVFGIEFVGAYANKAEISGVFVVFLAIFVLALLKLKCIVAKYTIKLVLCDEYYKKEFDSESNGVLKVKDKKISSFSKSQAVYDTVADKERKEEKKPAEPKKVELVKKEPIKRPEPKVEIDEEDEDDEEDNSKFGAANHYTFEQKLKMAKPIARKYFKEIKAYYEELGFKPNLTKSAETFSYKNTKFAIITTAGKSGLKIYLKLSPANYQDSTLPYKDVSDKKKYEKTPLMFVVKSDLAVRRAKALMDDIKATLENEKE